MLNLLCVYTGDHIALRGWGKFRGGLDVVSNSTGLQALYTDFNEFEIIFHVSTLLPFDSENLQQLDRKRHIGNDVVVIIFQDEDCDPFNPSLWSSHFNHVFVVIQPISEAAVPTQNSPEKPSKPKLTSKSRDLEESLFEEPIDMLEFNIPVTKYQFLFFFLYYLSKVTNRILQRISIVYKDVVSLHARPFLVEPFIYEADGEFRKFLLTKRNSNPLPSCDYPTT